MKLPFCLSSLMVIAVLGTASIAYAESCNAGHGCKITCPDGCSAVYYHDTNQCIAVCSDKARKLADEINDIKTKHEITFTTKGLKGIPAQEKVHSSPKVEPAKTPDKPKG